jgi:hypothetical protein
MFAIAGVQPIYTCKDCGYSGTVFPEVDDEEFKKLRKNANNNN